MKKVIITSVLVGVLITPSVMGPVSADSVNSSRLFVTEKRFLMSVNSMARFSLSNRRKAMSIKEILDDKFIKQISDTIVNSIEEAAKRVDNDSRVMTQKRAAEYLGISVPTFILLKKSGEFTPIQYPGVNQLYYDK